MPQLPVSETALARRIAAVRLLPAGAQVVRYNLYTIRRDLIARSRFRSAPATRQSRNLRPCRMLTAGGVHSGGMNPCVPGISDQHPGFRVPHDGLDPQGGSAPPPRRKVAWAMLFVAHPLLVCDCVASQVWAARCRGGAGQWVVLRPCCDRAVTVRVTLSGFFSSRCFFFFLGRPDADR